MKRFLLPLLLITQPAWADEIHMKIVKMEVVEDCNYPSTWTPVVDPYTKVVSYIVKINEACK